MNYDPEDYIEQAEKELDKIKIYILNEYDYKYISDNYYMAATIYYREKKNSKAFYYYKLSYKYINMIKLLVNQDFEKKIDILDKLFILDTNVMNKFKYLLLQIKIYNNENMYVQLYKTYYKLAKLYYKNGYYDNALHYYLNGVINSDINYYNNKYHEKSLKKIIELYLKQKKYNDVLKYSLDLFDSVKYTNIDLDDYYFYVVYSYILNNDRKNLEIFLSKNFNPSNFKEYSDVLEYISNCTKFDINFKSCYSNDLIYNFLLNIIYKFPDNNYQLT